MPLLLFENRESAYRAYFRSEKAAELRAQRREEALRRLGRES
jgi:hypothetical protein